MEFSSLRRSRLFWGSFAVLIFILYSYLAIRAPRSIYNSPDEMANAFFSSLFQKDSVLHRFEPLEDIARGRIYPRSIAVVEEFLVPLSFHGLPVLYGLLAKIFGLGLMVFFSPALAALAVLAWRRVIGTIFGRRAGDISALLLAITPAWWYWTNRGLYHNILFAALLIFSAYFFICKPFGRKNSISLSLYLSISNFILAGALLGFAIWVRSSEIFWVTLLVFGLWAIYRKLIRWREVIIFVIAAAVAFLPSLAINNSLYGSPLRTGYSPSESVIPNAVDGSLHGVYPEGSLLSFGTRDDQTTTPYTLHSTPYLLPFGFHPRTALENFTIYFLKLPWWMTLALAASLLWLGYGFFRGKRSREETVLVAIFFGVTGWLVAVYGSWVIHDNPDPTAVTIGISYSRYWLPTFVLASAVSGVAISDWMNRFNQKITGYWLPVTGYLFVVALSLNLVFLSKGDGLSAINKTLHGYATIKSDVFSRTEPEAVIVVDRADKIFFPDRRVIQPLRDESTYKVLPALALRVPLYYYGITMTSEDLKYHNEVKLPSLGLKLEVVNNYGNEGLYKITSR